MGALGAGIFGTSSENEVDRNRSRRPNVPIECRRPPELSFELGYVLLGGRGKL